MSPPAPTSASPGRGAVARLLGSPLFWLVGVGLLFGLPIARSVHRRLGAAPAVLGTLPAFALTDQAARPFGTRELAGKVWVADFVFTSCQQACPLLSQRMQEIGRRTKHLGPDFHLVSISVDPERDTPARLAEYAARYSANPVRWSFLTGPAQAIEDAVTNGFKIGMGKEEVTPDGGASFFEIFHGENLVLVDRELRIRGYFPASNEGLDQLVEAIGRVANGS
ncbi:MAG: SCO1/SenC family lipoprotein [Myxococcales bacterium]|nr:SCO1/SenC family lipoprotein [Myxococcales bacterium]